MKFIKNFHHNHIRKSLLWLLEHIISSFIFTWPLIPIFSIVTFIFLSIFILMNPESTLRTSEIELILIAYIWATYGLLTLVIVILSWFPKHFHKIKNHILFEVSPYMKIDNQFKSIEQQLVMINKKLNISEPEEETWQWK